MADHSPSPAPDLRLELLSQPNLLSAVRAMVGQVAQRIGFTEKECGQIMLAVDEAVCNIINHGYGRKPDGHIWMNLWLMPPDQRGIRIVLEDLGRQVEPETIRSRDLEDIRPGGLGVHIIHKTMDHVKYEKRSEGGMRLTMIKHVAAAAPTPGAGAGATAPAALHQQASTISKPQHEGHTHEGI